MLVLGGLCYTQQGSFGAASYCLAIGPAGALGLTIAGAILCAIIIVYSVIHCLCCVVTCGICCS